MFTYVHTPSVSEEEPGAFEAETIQSPSISLDRDEALEQLQEAWVACQGEDWDGYGAAPASIDAYLAAHRLLKALPEWAPDPEVDFSPQGNVLLEWYRAPRRVLTLSISEAGEIASSLLLGRTKRTGVALFIGGLPESLRSDLRRLYS